MTRRYAIAVGLAVAVVALDALTKRWAAANLTETTMVIIPGFLELAYTENPGAAFSLFQNAGPFLGLAAITVTGALLWSLRKDHHPLETAAYGLIIGGALGNLVDRVARGTGFLDGHVVDWVNLWWIPTFNVADMAITFGVGLLLIHAWQTR